MSQPSRLPSQPSFRRNQIVSSHHQSGQRSPAAAQPRYRAAAQPQRGRQSTHQPPRQNARSAELPRLPVPQPQTSSVSPPPPVKTYVRPTSKKGRIKKRRQVLIAGSSMLALTAFVAGAKPTLKMEPAAQNYHCQEKVQSQSVLSRAELSGLLALPERSSKAEVQEVISEPYCTLLPAAGESGVMAQREVYPLEFDPQTWFIVHYENDEYAAFEFSFRRE